ncbi:pyridoxal biosynthesis lyase PdxS [Clostridium botulinum]|uniref:pyridoxal 5'-phosphate synthase (glutamine hydrolyzing) n=1 Tax=Clostridium botulinum (strain Okra / Type B1) TaxID=498213 RepID=B1IKL2_CLOBK|nr:pyridoxal biosynthesis lyase PdxS [Clostridium botulinum B1 str. Okra]EKX80519.1 pyridoxal biosynthesis lyase PdxS [Clostridium botulinum CFSAN001628]MBD5563142.1 pyridoxal biosynthesis lyase PdxS [Clostridium botulinum]MBD5567225.1 pyridoxal biosynthesis lyase PdxS [Clostridium botulinum]MBD5570162.1 pyridoxal biosynthesis lyase PdxS [Clostridium botulinum]
MAKVRIGHFVEAQILEAIGVYYIDESEVLTPADAALMMQLGCDGIFVGSGIFKSDNPEKRAKAIVKATTHFKDPEVLAKVSENLGGAMSGLEISKLETEFAERGW